MAKFIVRNLPTDPNALSPGLMEAVRAYEDARSRRYDTREEAEAHIAAVDAAVIDTFGEHIASLSYNAVEEVAS